VDEEGHGQPPGTIAIDIPALDKVPDKPIDVDTQYTKAR